jgi:hypothetical protein
VQRLTHGSTLSGRSCGPDPRVPRAPRGFFRPVRPNAPPARNPVCAARPPRPERRRAEHRPRAGRR